MSDPHVVASRVNDLLVRWEDLREQGQELSVEELCATCPELSDRIARRIAALRRVHKMPDTDGPQPIDIPHMTSTRPGHVGFYLSVQSIYRVKKFLAHGGRSEIHVADDQSLGREVAVKTLIESHGTDRLSCQRLLREAEITARLDHPGVLPVYGMGTADNGRPFYCMRVVHGQTLRDAIDQFHASTSRLVDTSQSRLRLAELLRHFIDVCQTVANAHSRRIVHRDLKPENIMLGTFGTTFVVDWGLAKELSAVDPSADTMDMLPGLTADPVTHTGVAMGTPAYISPEQANGDTNCDLRSSDIFNLGATLYTILTGRPPYDGKHVVDVVRKAARCEFATPRQVSRRIHSALEAICLKAMSRNPRDRYDSAAAMADDVSRWIADEPVSCHADPMSRRFVRWVRRHRTQASSLLVLLVTVGLAVASVFITAEKNRANANFDRARGAINDSLVRVSENRLLNVPGLRPLRRDLLEASLRYYRQLLPQAEHDPSLRAELADALLRMGPLRRNSVDTLTHWSLSERPEICTSDSRHFRQMTTAACARWQCACGKSPLVNKSVARRLRPGRRLLKVAS